MIQPAFAVVCDNCLESAADWYAIGDRWIGACCWDPFGTLHTLPTPFEQGYPQSPTSADQGGLN